MKKTILITVLITALTGKTFSQLNMPLAMYSGNQIVYNPGYAGLYDVFAVNLSVNQSWMGLPGAPRLINLNGHSPFSEHSKHAWGWAYQHESWGPLAGNSVHANYSHQIQLANSILNLGLQAGALHQSINWTKIDYVSDEDDVTLGEGITHRVKFNAGVGAYFMAETWYLGISAMDLIQPKYGIHEVEGVTKYSQMRSQFYLMSGYSYNMGYDWSLRPEVFIRYVETMPILVNVGAHVFYDNRYAVGTVLRTGAKAVNLNVKITITDHIGIGYSHGIFYGDIKPYQRGSHEISIQYNHGISGARGGGELLWQ